MLRSIERYHCIRFYNSASAALQARAAPPHRPQTYVTFSTAHRLRLMLCQQQVRLLFRRSKSPSNFKYNLNVRYIMSIREANPVLSKWNERYGLPPFASIQAAHFPPAFEEAWKEHKNEVRSIGTSADTPTFENTIVALDRAGSLLSKVDALFENLDSRIFVQGRCAQDVDRRR